jgi:GNAT superfamily N-acetyltransferase
MPTSKIEILPFDGKGATQAEYAALNRHANRLRKERLPDDPPIPLEETLQNLHSIPPFVDLRLWAAWSPDQTEMVGLAELVLLRLEENQHMAQFDISVLPEYRRQGVGKQLLALITETARQDQRRLLMTNTVDRIPGGEAFMLRIGAQKGLEAHTNQLRMDELDAALVQDWLQRGEANLADFELGLWEGPYPDDKLPEVCELFDLTNQQPHGELEIEDIHLTPEQIRQMEANIFARGNQRWSFYVIERSTSKFAGYTETVWNPNRPEVLRQDMTGVFPQYRNKGLGRWLKAAMLDKVIRERPQVKYIRTGNADTNAAMLKINNELGFKPYLADALWQVEIEKVMEYLP